jgi:hypothetical protein
MAGLLGLLVTPVSAEPAAQTPVPAGPASGDPGVTAARTYGYYIWLDGNRIHLRTTDPGGSGSLYTGIITTDGEFRDVDVVRGEQGDYAIADRNMLEFRFHTANAVDGVTFAPAHAERLTFRLYRNGHLISTEHIFLGAGGIHPPGNPFTIAF